jgi:uncharacterized membrane protein YhdT
LPLPAEASGAHRRGYLITDYLETFSKMVAKSDNSVLTHTTVRSPEIKTPEVDPVLRDVTSFIQRSGTFVCKHPGITGMATVALGALTLLTYFLPLGFIPEFDLPSITGVLVIAALLGGVQIFWLGASLLFPTLLGVTNLYKPDVGKKYGVPVIVLTSTVAWIAILWGGSAADQDWFFFGLPLVFLGALVFFTMRWTRKWARYLFLIGVQGIVCLIAVFLFHPAPQSSVSEFSHSLQWIFLAVWCLLVSIANTALGKEGRPSLFAMVGVAAYLVFILVFMTQNLGYVHGMAIRILSLGDVRGVVLTVSDAGAAVLSAACQIESPPSGCAAHEIAVGQTRSYAYKNIKILSRIGSQYYVQLCADTDKGGACDTIEGLRVVVEKSDVRGWSTAGATLKKSIKLTAEN